jgi:hypothetical protein
MQNYENKLVDSSRMIADILTSNILDNQERFDEMLQLALRDKYPLSMRAARIIELCTLNHKHLIIPHVEKLVDSIEKSKIDGVRRSFLKILSVMPSQLNEELQGRLIELAFSYLEDKKEAIAVRAFAIDFLIKMIQVYPELKNELIYLLEEINRDSSVGLQSKCKKVLTQLKKYK